MNAAWSRLGAANLALSIALGCSALACCARGAIGAEPQASDAEPRAKTLAVSATAMSAKSAAAEPTLTAEDAGLLIDQLADDAFAVRETATKKLIQIGITAKPFLTDALDSNDAEVRLRARRVLDLVVAADRRQRIQAFRSDVDGKAQATLPGWNDFKKLAGEGKIARDLFVEMSQAEPALLEALDQGPQQAAESLKQRCASPALQPNISGIRVGNMKLSTGSMLAMIYVAGNSEVPLGDDATKSVFSLFSYVDILAFRSNNGDQRRDTCLKLISRWIARDMAAKDLPKCVALATQFNLKEGLGPAVKVVQQPDATPMIKCASLRLIGKFGGPDQIDLVEPLLRDTQPCLDSGVMNQRFEAAGLNQPQIRDFALLTMIRLNGQNPKEFGFTGVDGVSGAEINPYAGAFKNEHERSAAFLKWQVWQKGQKQASRDKATGGSARE